MRSNVAGRGGQLTITAIVRRTRPVTTHVSCTAADLGAPNKRIDARRMAIAAIMLVTTAPSFGQQRAPIGAVYPQRSVEASEATRATTVTPPSPFYEEPTADGEPAESSIPTTIDSAAATQIEPTQYVGGPASSTVTADSPAPPSWQPSAVAPPDVIWKPTWLKSGQSTFSYVPASAPTDFGFVGLDQRLSLSTPHPFLTINPRFGILWSEGPTSPAPTVASAGPDTPGQLFDVSVEARWFQPLSEQWVMEVAVAPGFYSDGENTSSDSVRVVGRALAFYKWSEAVRIGVGAVYLDRDDVNVLPAAGLMIYPNYDTKLELVFPRPKLAYRILRGDGFDRWAYVAGEFGGGQWAIERNLSVPGAGPPPIVTRGNDVLSYRDYRVLFGLEEKSTDGFGWIVEGGFLFGREFEYESGQGTQSVDASAIVRIGLQY